MQVLCSGKLLKILDRWSVEGETGAYNETRRQKRSNESLETTSSSPELPLLWLGLSGRMDLLWGSRT